jgi:hypothetical protein
MKIGELYSSTHLSCLAMKQEGEAHSSRQISSDVRRSAFDVRYSFPFVCAVVLLFLSLGSAKAQVSREYQLKAVFLYNFAQFTDWPTNTFADDKSPIVIGIIGPDPFGSALEDTIRNETVVGHPLTIQHYSSPADIKTCHILFITQPEIRHADEILKAIDGKPVLTVADADNPATAKVMIRFAVENNKVHFRINTETARAANVSLSSKLLRVADATPSRRAAP